MLKINGNNAAVGARKLVKQTGAFAEVYVFGVLRSNRHCFGVDFLVVIEAVKNKSHHYFKRRRR